jgi:hypothetical protein
MSDESPFYVGYGKFPVPLRSLYVVLAVGLLVLSVGVSYFVSSNQEQVGDGVWNLAEQTEIEGFLTVDPYPVIHQRGKNPRSVILVVQGKKSADDFAKLLENRRVRARGFEIARGGWTILELTGEEAIEAIDETTIAYRVPSEDLGPVTLTGEIVDSKCFLGVMKPGYGKVHRACASLCLLGGMPPMLVSKNSAGEKLGYVVTHHDGQSASRALSSIVAVPVTVNATAERRGDLIYLRLLDGQRSITPLAGQNLLSYGASLAVNENLSEQFCGVMTLEGSG